MDEQFKIIKIVVEIVNIEKYICKSSNDKYLYLQVLNPQDILQLLKKKRIICEIIDDKIKILLTRFEPNKGENYFICENCKFVIDETDDYVIKNKEKVCSLCVIKYMFKCDECNLHFWSNEKNIIEYGMGYDDKFIYCNECYK